MSQMCINIGLETWFCKNLPMLSLDALLIGGIFLLIGILLRLNSGGIQNGKGK